MADTQRTKAELIALSPDNNTKLISPQVLRDFIESMSCSDGSFYFTTILPTTIVTPGTYVKAAGGTTLVDAHRTDMPVDGQIRYLGRSTVHAHIVCNLSVQCASNNQVLGFAIAKNGSILAHSVMEHFLANSATDIKVMAIHADTDLSTGDYLELFVTNETSTGAVTIKRGYLYFMGMMCV